MSEERYVEVDIVNVECPTLYQVEFRKRWEFLFRLPPMTLQEIKFLVIELGEKIGELDD